MADLTENTPIEGALLFKRKVYGDQRGVFCELYRKTVYEEYGAAITPQISISNSQTNVLRSSAPDASF